MTAKADKASQVIGTAVLNLIAQSSSRGKADSRVAPIRLQIRFWKGVFSLSPNGTPQQSPRVARNELPWATDQTHKNPNGVSASNNVCCVSKDQRVMSID